MNKNGNSKKTYELSVETRELCIELLSELAQRREDQKNIALKALCELSIRD